MRRNTRYGGKFTSTALSQRIRGKITFSVTDTGPGVPADQADYVFDRFSKLDEFKQGTGLGLNICSIIAGRLKGEVKLDKSYTKGARFLFILPLDNVPDS